MTIAPRNNEGWAPPSQRGSERAAFTYGMVLGYDTRSPIRAVMYDGFNLVSVIQTAPTQIGKFYNVYPMHGKFFAGSEINIRYR